MHVPRLLRAFIDPSFLGFLTYLLSFETNTALKITIKYRQARFRAAILKQLMLLDPYPQSQSRPQSPSLLRMTEGEKSSGETRVFLTGFRKKQRTRTCLLHSILRENEKFA